MKALRNLLRKLQRELKVYRLIVSDNRTPRVAKLLLAFAIFYAVSPLDLIPDFIPVIGLLDDVIIVPGLIILALRLTPKDVVEDCRVRAYGT
ncbi:MAG: DUF1232 domain-containing protein [Chloroflexi bacterium]|nr:DUF1232 domain-containing protein [Chloroflexota bacterium]